MRPSMHRQGGTGSYPPSFQGLQRRMRHAASPPPRTTPCARSASIAYSLQLGSKRQFAPMNGRSVH